MSTFRAQVRGVPFYSLSECGAVVGDRVELVRRPDNPHDVNCVEVRALCHGRSFLVGNLAAEVAQRLSPLISSGTSTSG